MNVDKIKGVDLCRVMVVSNNNIHKIVEDLRKPFS